MLCRSPRGTRPGRVLQRGACGTAGPPKPWALPSQTKGAETWSSVSVALVLGVQVTRQIVPCPSCLFLASFAQGCLRTLLTQAALRSLQASASCRKWSPAAHSHTCRLNSLFLLPHLSAFLTYHPRKGCIGNKPQAA